MAQTETVTDTSCSADSINCVINCNDCPDTVNCPTTGDCESCTINCLDSESCQNSNIYGNSCSDVVVNCNDASDSSDSREDSSSVAQQSKIYAPNNYGNLTLNVIAGGDCFEQAEIFSLEASGYMKIYCNDPQDDEYKNECKQMQIDATLSTNLEMICTGKCQESTVYCPDNEFTENGPYDTPCYIECLTGVEDDDECKQMTIYATGGTPTDVIVRCDEDEKDSCRDASIICTAGTCDFEQGDDDIWLCDGECYFTNSPTLYPPTSIPTIYSPTEMPVNGSIIIREFAKNDKKTGGSDVDAIAYNIIFGLVFLAIFGLAVFKFVRLYRDSFFDTKSRIFIVILGLLAVSSFWEFLVCMVLGGAELYVSRKDFGAGTFLVSVSFPINFYIVLAVLITISFHNKFVTMNDAVAWIDNKSRGRGPMFVLLVIFSILFVFWMLMSLILVEDNKGNLVFNSFMIITYSLIGMAIIVGVVVMYFQKFGLAGIRSEQTSTKDVALGIGLAFSSFFMFFFYLVLGAAVATSGADGVRVVLLLFEISTLLILCIMYPEIGSDIETANMSMTNLASGGSDNTQAVVSASGVTAVTGPYNVENDPHASLFDVKNISKLKEDKIEYVEVLSNDARYQSDNKWQAARILEVRTKTNQVWIEYLPDGSTNDKENGNNNGGANPTEIMDLNNENQAARFRINIFSHPEPWKLPMNEDFGIPDVLCKLLDKLLELRGDLEMGIFRKSAEEKKKGHFQTAICQYNMDNYDYRRPEEFEVEDDKANAFDVHCLAALIKDWIRKFPETIVKYDDETESLMPNKTGSQNDDLKENLMLWLAYLTVYLANPELENKMTEKSLAIVIAPNLIGEDLSPTESLRLARDLNDGFETFCVSLRDQPNPIQPPQAEQAEQPAATE